MSKSAKLVCLLCAAAAPLSVCLTVVLRRLQQAKARIDAAADAAMWLPEAAAAAVRGCLLEI